MRNPLARLPQFRSEVIVLAGTRMLNSLFSFVRSFMAYIYASHLSFKPEAIGLAMALATGAQVLGQYIGGDISDRLERRTINAKAFALSGSAFILPLVNMNVSTMAIALSISNFFNGVSRNAINAAITDNSPRSMRAAAFSLAHVGLNIGYVVAPFAARYLLDVSLKLTFAADPVSTLGAALMVSAPMKNDSDGASPGGRLRLSCIRTLLAAVPIRNGSLDPWRDIRGDKLLRLRC